MNTAIRVIWHHVCLCFIVRLRPIMPKILPIILLSHCSKIKPIMLKITGGVCFQNHDYAQELTVLVEYISLSWLLY